MAPLAARLPRGSQDRHHAGAHLPGEDALSAPGEPPAEPTVDLRLSLDEAEALHAYIEDASSPELRRCFGLLSWRLLAVRGGTGLTGRLANIARSSETLEEYEAVRDAELGPIIDALESDRNRDP